jgi:hypothetical protein
MYNVRAQKREDFCAGDEDAREGSKYVGKSENESS